MDINVDIVYILHGTNNHIKQMQGTLKDSGISS